MSRAVREQTRRTSSVYCQSFYNKNTIKMSLRAQMEMGATRGYGERVGNKKNARYSKQY